jgi:hypothetical protein
MERGSADKVEEYPVPDCGVEMEQERGRDQEQEDEHPSIFNKQMLQIKYHLRNGMS